MQLGRWTDPEGRLPLFIAGGVLVVVLGVLGILAATSGAPEKQEQEAEPISLLPVETGASTASESANASSADEAASAGETSEGAASESVAGARSEPEEPGRVADTPAPVADLAGSSRHVVSSGETLYGISRKHYGTGSFWRELARANSMDDGAVKLRVGQELVIPSKDAMVAMVERRPESTRRGPATVELEDASEPLASATGSPPTTSGATYVVKPGDTLWSIASRKLGSGLKWELLAAANPDLANGELKVGQRIVIPSAE